MNPFKPGGGRKPQPYSTTNGRYTGAYKLICCSNPIGDWEIRDYKNGGLRLISKKEMYEELLIKTVQREGEKIDPELVISIFYGQNHKITWIERGDETKGFKHIVLKHGEQFENVGIPKDKICALIEKALNNGRLVGYQNCKRTRPIYLVDFENRTQLIAITVADNGFVIGANPRTIIKRKEKVL